MMSTKSKWPEGGNDEPKNQMVKFRFDPGITRSMLRCLFCHVFTLAFLGPAPFVSTASLQLLVIVRA
jgi:hypothetical protein